MRTTKEITVNNRPLADVIGLHGTWSKHAGSSGEKAELAGADLHEADLAAVNLAGANLRNADLTGANFHGANLAAADLTGAKMAGADFSGANLRDALCHNVMDILEAQGMETADLRGMKSDDEALFFLSRINLTAGRREMRKGAFEVK